MEYTNSVKFDMQNIMHEQIDKYIHKNNICIYTFDEYDERVLELPMSNGLFMSLLYRDGWIIIGRFASTISSVFYARKAATEEEATILIMGNIPDVYLKTIDYNIYCDKEIGIMRNNPDIFFNIYDKFTTNKEYTTNSFYNNKILFHEENRPIVVMEKIDCTLDNYLSDYEFNSDEEYFNDPTIQYIRDRLIEIGEELQDRNIHYEPHEYNIGVQYKNSEKPIIKLYEPQLLYLDRKPYDPKDFMFQVIGWDLYVQFLDFP